MFDNTDPVDFVEKSIELSNASQDYCVAIEALSSQWPLISASHGDRLRSIIEGLPDDAWRDDPWIIAAVGASYRSIGSPSRSAALPYFQTAEKLIAIGASPASVLPAVLLHHAAALRTLGLLDSALAKAESAWALLQNEVELAPSRRAALQAKASLQLGLIKLHLGQYDAANTHLRLASGLSEHGLTPADQVECNAGLSFIAYAIGDWDDAENHVARAREAAIDSGLMMSGFGAGALVTAVLIAADRNDLVGAQMLVPQLALAAHRSDWEPLSLYARSAAAGVNGQLIEALDLQRRSISCARGWEGTPVVRVMGEMLRGGLLLHLGEVDAATGILQGVAPTENHADCPARLVAGVRFGEGNAAGCLEALRSCHELGDSHSSRSMIDVLLLTAAASYELGSLIAADIALDRALYLGSQTGARVPFVIIPRVTMVRMLDRASDRNQPPAVHQLLDELRSGSAGRPSAIDPLSERERDIAQHLFQDKTVSQIAAELFISTNTVKTHVRSIYRKLSASTRKEAIQRVRELGLNLNITPY